MSIVPSTQPSTPLDPRPSREERLRACRPQIRVIIAGAQPLHQAEITYMHQIAGLEVVATASASDDLARKTRAHHPDVAIVDLDIAARPHDHGRAETARPLRSIEPELAILVLSSRPPRPPPSFYRAGASHLGPFSSPRCPTPDRRCQGRSGERLRIPAQAPHRRP